MLWAAICCLILGSATTLVAQNENGRQRTSRRGGMPTIALVDTAITNAMQLEAPVQAVIGQINARYAQAMRQHVETMRQMGQNASDEERQAMMQNMKAQRYLGYQQLRQALGDETYILYLQEALDKQATMQQGRGMNRRQPMGGGGENRRGGNRRGVGAGFGGDDFGSSFE